MKKMKKWSAWLIVAMMLVSLVGCAKEPTPQEVYTAAYEKVNSMTDMDAEMTMDITMSMGGETMDMGIDADLLMKNPNSEDMTMDMKMAMDMLGITIDIQAYYVDGYYLMDMMGQKLKYQMPLEEAMSQASMAQEVAVEALSEITMTKEGDNRILNFSVDADKMMEGYMDDYMADMGLTDSSAAESIEYKSMTGVMTVNKEGYPVSISMEMAFSMEVEGSVVDCEATVEVVYNNPGQEVTIELPDASEYTEVDPETMS